MTTRAWCDAALHGLSDGRPVRDNRRHGLRFERGRFVPATAFRPVPRVDAAVLTIQRRTPPLLPPAMARKYAEFVRGSWPFRMNG